MTIFKSRCAKDNFISKSATFMLSNHPIKLHHNMKQYEIHKGLNREYYEVTDYDLWIKTDMEKGIRLIKNRTSTNSQIKMRDLI